MVVMVSKWHFSSKLGQRFESHLVRVIKGLTLDESVAKISGNNKQENVEWDHFEKNIEIRMILTS